MADIFLSYAREDLRFAEKLAKALETQGWSVWWDRRLAPGDRFNEAIKGQLDNARCAVTIWSRKSVGSLWVRDEAQYALDQKKLLPVLADDVDIPLGFRGIHAADLRGWRGISQQHSGFQRLVGDISERLGSEPKAPQPKPPVSDWLRREASWLRETASVAGVGILPIIQGIANRSKVWFGGSTKRKLAIAASAGVLILLVTVLFYGPPSEKRSTLPIFQSTNIDGIQAQITKCHRTKYILDINLQLVNNTKETKSILFVGSYSPRYDNYYITANGKKYIILRGPDKVPLATPTGIVDLSVSIEGGRAYTFWAKYPAPPPDVKSLTFYTPFTSPFEDVPITDSR